MQENSSKMNEVESDQECQCLLFSPCILEVNTADVVDAVFSQTQWDLTVKHHAASRTILSVVLISQRGADLHIAQHLLLLLPLSISHSSKSRVV